MEIGGLVSLSTVDDPSRLAAVVFCQGCPWRCRYCHNPALQPKHAAEPVSWRRVEELLVRRCGLLESVVFSGGEPTLQPNLADAVRCVRRLGYRVGLHTAGIFPGRLADILGLVDWVGLDIKAPVDLYRRITGSPMSARRAEQSLGLVLEAAESGLEYEVRTTFHPDLLGEDDLRRLAESLARRGVRRFAVQRFRPQGCANNGLRTAARVELSPATLRHLESYFDQFVLR